MALITLTSDYGTLDYRVAAIKGSILSLMHDVRIVDITHDIQAYNLLQTAYILRSAYRYYPKGTIHIISVDSFYHKQRKNIIAKIDGHYFICADNGLLSLAFKDIHPEEIYEIRLNNRFDDEVQFATTDLFVPAAVHLANGGVPELVGNKIEKLRERRVLRAIFTESDRLMVGEVIYMDNYGNAVSNISKVFFAEKLSGFKTFEMKFRSFILTKIYNCYTGSVGEWEREESVHGNAVAIFNEFDYLTITIYKGSKTNGASTLLGLKVGDRILIEFK